MQAISRQTSELNPPENITPSIKTTMSGLLVLLLPFLFFLSLFTGFIKL